MREIGLDVHRDFCEVAICEAGEICSSGSVQLLLALIQSGERVQAGEWPPGCRGWPANSSDSVQPYCKSPRLPGPRYHVSGNTRPLFHSPGNGLSAWQGLTCVREGPLLELAGRWVLRTEEDRLKVVGFVTVPICETLDLRLDDDVQLMRDPGDRSQDRGTCINGPQCLLVGRDATMHDPIANVPELRCRSAHGRGDL